MTPIPTDAIGAALWGVNLLIEALSISDAHARLREGIAARAEAEGRDVTEDEERLLDALLADSKKVRDGTV